MPNFVILLTCIYRSGVISCFRIRRRRKGKRQKQNKTENNSGKRRILESLHFTRITHSAKFAIDISIRFEIISCF